MPEHDLLAPGRVGPRRRRSHDGIIVPDTIDTMWGTDLTATFTGEGPASVFIAVDHCSAECVGIHAHARATRFEALEPIRQGLRRYFGGFAANVAHGLAVRHDHGSQYMSDHFQREIAFLGIKKGHQRGPDHHLHRRIWHLGTTASGEHMGTKGSNAGAAIKLHLETVISGRWYQLLEHLLQAGARRGAGA